MFKILEGGTEPQIKTEFSSSADLCSRETITIFAGNTKVIPLGVKIDLNYFREYFYDSVDTEEDLEVFLNKFLKSHFLELKIRSSLSFKLIVANGVGEIDLDYPDEIGLIVHNPMSDKATDLSAKAIGIAFELKKQGISSEDIIEAQTKFLEEHRKDLFVNIKAGDRVAQIKLMEHKNDLMPNKYRTSKNRTGGFGSTN